MDQLHSQTLLTVLIENTRRILCEGFGIAHAEHSMLAVIDLIEREPLLKQVFLQRVARTLEKMNAWGQEEGDVPRELVELSAHHFRWPEFAELAQRRLQHFFRGDEGFAVSDICATLVEALETDWEDIEFYDCYRRRN